MDDAYRILVLILVAGAGAYWGDGHLDGRWKKVFLQAVLAAGAYLGGLALDRYELARARPEVSVALEPRADGLAVSVEVSRGSVESVGLDFRVPGWVLGVEDLNSASEGVTSVWMQGEPRPPYLTNNLQLLLDVRAGRRFNYRILHRAPALPPDFPGPVSVAGDDRYKKTVIWRYKGEKFIDETWLNLANNMIVDEPGVLVGPATLYVGPDAAERAANPAPVPNRQLNGGAGQR